ncbi:MAG TPA: TIGR03862 family flavoprotein [Rhodopila sp.]|uniref:TIGR03862 family flavoprotein n=1 Tax=Rhodopila sp. TaxID=2480087 RepID=UPI002C9B46E9|nr:TIGR03862 family flavoprotein [Rhodopila sp.]HVY14693.1 TIGR03862 family flavoprotein [Rhodopila sp.]
MTRRSAAVVGGGPAGLIAAEFLSAAGVAVTVYDRMPSVGRKLLMAGRSGLNLTHSEALPDLLARYGAARGRLAPLIEAFPPEALVAWCEGLGQPTFVGSSGRVFPVAMKASPLLRAWLGRLAARGVVVRPRHGWMGWDGDALRFQVGGGDGRAVPGRDGGGVPGRDADGVVAGRAAPALVVRPDVTVLALGGASWPRLGSDAAWTPWMAPLVTPFRPANCGFAVAWSAPFRDRFAGRPLKRLALRFGGTVVRGEAVVTSTGIEGGAVYALSAPLRDAIETQGSATLAIDLRPDLCRAALAERLGGPARGQSLSNRLRKQAGLSAEAIGLVQEALHAGAPSFDLAGLIKALPLRLTGTVPIDRAISSAGGLRWDALDEGLMLRDRPGVFAAGEMLDWEAPTGGYLLQACFSTGVAAARGALRWLEGGTRP